ncbi:MAG: HTH domain-containing protein [Chitinophagaceae bacterium]|jgi:hypothetical protein|nr:HTH domain-containing protein [Chitinophagaceae bacterium]
MTLHDAIQQLLRQQGRPMTTKEIADALNKNKWYVKKDQSIIASSQIDLRTRNYSGLFQRNGTTVSLIGQPNTKVTSPAKANPEEIKQAPKTLTVLGNDTKLLEKVLMNEKNYKLPVDADELIPDKPGLYCLRLKSGSRLPEPFQKALEDRKHNIIYIGIASQSLHKRLMQELRAKGHGTFFRSLGAVLGFRPEKGSLTDKANKRNYTFSAKDEKTIINWINQHLLVNWINYEGDFESFETYLIEKYLPLLNLDKNPAALKALSDLRAECVRIANAE